MSEINDNKRKCAHLQNSNANSKKSTPKAKDNLSYENIVPSGNESDIYNDEINDIESTTVCDVKASNVPSKKKKKEKKPKKKEIAQKQAATSGSSGLQAIEYLRKWYNNRDTWHFMKVRQVWLLNNMYDPTKMEDADFQIMLKYIDGMKGFARTVTVDKAEKLVASADISGGNSDEEAEKDEEGKMDPRQLERVKEVLQVLG